MKTLSYVWNILINILTIVIVLAIFSTATNKFETITFSVLVLIYFNITEYGVNTALIQLKFAEAIEEEFKELKKLITNESETEGLTNEDEVIEVKRQKIEANDKIMTKYYIGLVFRFIIWLIAIYNLFLVLK